MSNKNIRSPRTGKNLKIITAVAVAVCILINLLICLIPASAMRMEVTKDGNLSISEDTKNFLNSMSNETVAYVVDADGTDRRFEYFMQEIDACSDKIKVKFVKSDSDEIQQVIRDNSITTVEILPYSLIISGKNGATFIAYENMMYYMLDSALHEFVGSDRLDIKSYRECLQYVESGISQDPENATTWQNVKDLLLNNSVRVFYGEEIICRMVEYVNVDSFPARYYVTGHGEKELNKTELGYNMAYMSVSYSISYYKQLDTSKIDALPEDAVALIILDPKSDFSAQEAQMFINFVKKGGDVTLVTSDGCRSMPNIMSVVNAFGLSAENGLLTEEKEIKKPETDEEPTDTEKSGEEADGEQGTGTENETPSTYISDSVEVTPNAKHGAMAFLLGNFGQNVTCNVKNANSILYENVDPNVELTPLLTTSDKVMLDGVKVNKALATAVIAEYVTSKGMISWYTGAESYTVDLMKKDSNGKYDTQGKSEEELEAMVSDLLNVYSVSGMMLLSPKSYESEIPSVAPKPFANDLFNVTDKNFIVYIVVALLLTLGVCAIGGAVCYSRRKR